GTDRGGRNRGRIMNKTGTEKFFRSGSERNIYEKTPGMSCVPGADVPHVRSRSGGDPSDQRESSSGIGAGMDRGASGGCDLRRGAVLPGYGIFLFCLSETSLSDQSVREISHRKC